MLLFSEVHIFFAVFGRKLNLLNSILSSDFFIYFSDPQRLMNEIFYIEIEFFLDLAWLNLFTVFFSGKLTLVMVMQVEKTEYF